MNKTLKTTFAIAALGASTIASAITIPASGTVAISDTVNDGNLIGGEFEAMIPGFDSFYTFCLEKQVHLPLPGEFDYAISSATDGGYTANGGWVAGGDVLSAGSAYLYEKFIHGNLYVRDGSAAHDLAAGALQVAIWYLENEVGSGFVGVAGNVFLADAYSEFGSEAAAKANDTRGVVKVMNLTRENVQNGMYQDVLVYVPDSGATLLFLGLGLGAVALVRRRR